MARKPLRLPLKMPRGVVELVVEEPAEGHDAEVAVLAEVVEEERPLGDDQALDRLDEELVGERRLEPADPDLELGVEVEVEEDVEDRDGVEAVRRARRSSRTACVIRPLNMNHCRGMAKVSWTVVWPPCW